MRLLSVSGLIACLLSALCLPAQAAERVYYIAAEEVAWDYAPADRDVMMGHEFNADQQVFVQSGDGLIGAVYKKALYREYTDASFATPKPRPAQWAHLGALGPVIHAEVGDTIKVVFRNNASRPYTVHPHGVFYTKANEGSPYADGTAGADKADDFVQPGGTYTYEWSVPERAGPAPGDGSSIGWPYHSHVHEPMDTNTGLMGVMVITARGMARPDGTPKDVDRELVTLFTVYDENRSWYLAQNIADYAGGADADPELFEESNLMHAVNGYVYGSIPNLTMKQGERVRWYLMSMGTEVDLHTPHWHGNTGVMNGRRVDTIGILPAETRVVDMTPDNPGIWMFHCHVNDHLEAGMTALYEVLPETD